MERISSKKRLAAKLAVKCKMLLSNNKLSYFWEKGIFIPRKYKLSSSKLSIAVFCLICHMGFDDKTSKVLGKSHSFSKKTLKHIVYIF